MIMAHIFQVPILFSPHDSPPSDVPAANGKTNLFLDRKEQWFDSQSKVPKVEYTSVFRCYVYNYMCLEHMV